MYKDLKNTKYWDAKEEYYMAVLDEMRDGGNSYAMDPDDGYSGRHRDSIGRYARSDSRDRSYNRGSSYDDGRMRDGRRTRGGDGYDRYIDSKHSYRSNKSSDCKQRMMDALEDYMDDFAQKMEDMMRDSDCAEERTTIKRYIDKIKNIV